MPMHRTAPPPRDWSRQREGMRGMPKNFISMGTVGHLDFTPEYVRVQDGDVLVEVTLAPSGDEIVARLDLSAVDTGGLYFPISYGQRVVVATPQGRGGDAVIVGRCNDQAWPFPPSVAGVSTGPSAPMFVFLRTADGQLLAIQTGDGADILIHSGGGLQLKTLAGEHILLTGRTHIGAGADWTSPPTGAQVTDAGFAAPGDPGVNYVPIPNTNTVIPPVLDTTVVPPVPKPADGVVRIKDPVQSNITIDQAFWAWVAAMGTAVGQLAAYVNALVPGTVTLPPVPPPSTLTSQHADGSLNTCADG